MASSTVAYAKANASEFLGVAEVDFVLFFRFRSSFCWPKCCSVFRGHAFVVVFFFGGGGGEHFFGKNSTPKNQPGSQNWWGLEIQTNPGKKNRVKPLL